MTTDPRGKLQVVFNRLEADGRWVRVESGWVRVTVELDTDGVLSFDTLAALEKLMAPRLPSDGEVEVGGSKIRFVVT